jgi:hypothetical protein
MWPRKQEDKSEERTNNRALRCCHRAPGSGQAAMLHYMTLNVEWSNDHKIMVLPVTF